jgi:hypothetical protein
MKTIRKFHSYESVDTDLHYYVPREELIGLGYDHLVGEAPQKGGHYITVWAPRQTGKSWIMREIVSRIKQRGDFEAAILTMQSAKNAQNDQAVLKIFIDQMRSGFERDLPYLDSWEQVKDVFARTYFDKPVILVLDEFDSMGEQQINSFANELRSMYGYRRNEKDRLTHEKTCLLHGLALVGVRSVLGTESESGSPFNVQRSLHIPNLTFAEVEEMFRWYERESGQKVEDPIIGRLYYVTKGQPGLIGWFGELLTEKYNTEPGKPLGEDVWKLVWLKARFAEPNNTVMNLIAKAREAKYRRFLLELFTKPDIPFSFNKTIHSYLYMHGIIASDTVEKASGELSEICRFSSPFIQDCIYEALGHELVSDKPILAIEIGDTLDDVFDPAKKNPDLAALLHRYKDYLVRLKAAGRDPWKQQPRRKTDLQLTEAVGHFYLYAWLRDAIGDLCIVSPEFPTGNGKVDIHIRCEERRGIIELKSFRNVMVLRRDRGKAAGYAKSLGLDAITMAVFVPVLDEAVLAELSGSETVDGIEVTAVAIGWV